jgi:peroxiredoxin
MEKDSLVGKLAQDFSLTDTNGRVVSLAQFRGKGKVVLVFNRGFA